MVAAMPNPARKPAPSRRTEKSPSAFRTISEVAEDLEVPQHVLRFWETKFPQVRPLKRGGGRRYYRPEDVDLLRRIRGLLYDQGYTIKGVQRLLREGGLRQEAVAAATAASGAVPESAEQLLPGLLDEDARKHALKEVLDELLDCRRMLKAARSR